MTKIMIGSCIRRKEEEYAEWAIYMTAFLYLHLMPIPHKCFRKLYFEEGIYLLI